jgi:hypothetical protein
MSTLRSFDLLLYKGGGRLAEQQKRRIQKHKPNIQQKQEKRVWFYGYTGLRPVRSQTTISTMAMMSRICIRKPAAGSSSQPKSQSRMMTRAIHNRIDMLKT